MEEIVLGGGCFWCVEAVFQDVPGVIGTEVGYAGGTTEEPTYREVCSGRTGHAEVARVKFDQDKISLEQILEIFFATHDPETKDREGPDIGSQYRSIVLYRTEEQKKVAKEVISCLENGDVYNSIVTEVEKLDEYHTAEEKHQEFFRKNPNSPYCQAHIPKKLRTVENLI